MPGGEIGHGNPAGAARELFSGLCTDAGAWPERKAWFKSGGVGRSLTVGAWF